MVSFNFNIGALCLCNSDQFSLLVENSWPTFTKINFYYFVGQMLSLWNNNKKKSAKPMKMLLCSHSPAFVCLSQTCLLRHFVSGFLMSSVSGSAFFMNLSYRQQQCSQISFCLLPNSIGSAKLKKKMKLTADISNLRSLSYLRSTKSWLIFC